jgi:hypothetical protein
MNLEYWLVRFKIQVQSFKNLVQNDPLYEQVFGSRFEYKQCKGHARRVRGAANTALFRHLLETLSTNALNKGPQIPIGDPNERIKKEVVSGAGADDL